MSKDATPEDKNFYSLQDTPGFRKQKAATSLKDWIMGETDAVELELESFSINIFRT